MIFIVTYLLNFIYIFVLNVADVSGFTAVSESLAMKGDIGAEELGMYLNRYFEIIGRVVSEANGDIIKFVGDALVIMV